MQKCLHPFLPFFATASAPQPPGKEIFPPLSGGLRQEEGRAGERLLRPLEDETFMPPPPPRILLVERRRERGERASSSVLRPSASFWGSLVDNSAANMAQAPGARAGAARAIGGTNVRRAPERFSRRAERGSAWRGANKAEVGGGGGGSASASATADRSTALAWPLSPGSGRLIHLFFCPCPSLLSTQKTSAARPHASARLRHFLAFLTLSSVLLGK